MKRFAIVALLAATLFGVTSASAAELKVRGGFDVYAQFSQNLRDLSSSESDVDTNTLAQRARMYFDYVTSQNLSMTVGLEVDQDWGEDTDAINGAGGWASDQKTQLELKHAFLTFIVPETEIQVRAGLQPIALPGVFGSPVFDEDVHALHVSAPINDMFAVTAGYARLQDATNDADGGYDTGSGSSVAGDEIDAAYLLAPVTLDGFAATPYLVYGHIGSQEYAVGFPGATDNTLWWGGVNAKLTLFDPLTVEGDFVYGASSIDSGVTNAEDRLEARGWYGALAASYKLDMVTPMIFGTYGSGNDEDPTDGSEALPVMREGWGLAPNSGDRMFSTTYDAWGAVLGHMDDGTGMWSVGLKLSDISFVENLSHQLTIAYMRGTSDYSLDNNAVNLVDFTKKDSAWEVHLGNQYMIYENLAAIVEMGYFNADLKDRTPNVNGDWDDDASAFVAMGFQYRF